MLCRHSRNPEVNYSTLLEADDREEDAAIPPLMVKNAGRRPASTFSKDLWLVMYIQYTWCMSKRPGGVFAHLTYRAAVEKATVVVGGRLLSLGTLDTAGDKQLNDMRSSRTRLSRETQQPVSK